MRTIRSLLLLILVAVAAITGTVPAMAWEQQGLYATSTGGTANAQTVTIPNVTAYADIVGVVISFVPTNANTGALQVNVNSLGLQTVDKQGPGGLIALVGGEVEPSTVARMMWDGTQFELLNPVQMNVHAAGFVASAFSYGEPLNLGITAAIASNNLVLNVVNNAGATPTSSTPVPIVFRTSGSGLPTVATVKAALTFTIDAGNSMGCTSAVVCRLWLIALDNSGTVQFCAVNLSTPGTILALNEAANLTSGGGTTGGSTLGTTYCNASAVTGQIRNLGYVEATYTSGNWASVGVIQLMGPGVKKPGDSVQTVTYSTTASVTGGSGATKTAIAWSATANITPTSVVNQIKVTIVGVARSGSGTNGYIGLFRGTTSTVIGSQYQGGTETASTPSLFPVYNWVFDSPATTSAQTYGAYVNGAGIVWLSTAGSSCPVACTGYLILEEVMGALPEPANDDGGPMRMVG